MSELYDIYLKYQGKETDDDYIYQLFDILMEKEQDLIPYINNLIVNEDNDNNLGCYYMEKKIITINKKNINNHHIPCKNVIALQTLKHEIEHARNLKKIEYYGSDMESMVIFYALKHYALTHGLCSPIKDSNDIIRLSYNIANNYETNPGERISDIKSWKFIVNLLKNQRTTEELLVARSMLYYSYIRGYKDNRYYLDCPTFTFLLNTNQLEDLKKLKLLIDKSKFSLDTRLLCGLPISYNEYNKEVLRKAKIKRKNN